ncbi:MAG: Low molecular weight protein-tyrosine-phosphatase [Actinomycetota bacterium]|jgi:protein-tyrosine phosphatase
MSHSVLMVCMGNICRSPIAEHVMRAKAEAAGLDFTVASAGTGGWHAGEPADHRAAAVLDQYGYTSDHRAQQFKAEWFENYDIILVMDEDNRDGVLQHAKSDAHKNKVQLIRSFDSGAPKHAVVPDPYYGNEDGFVKVLEMIERACDGYIAQHISE